MIVIDQCCKAKYGHEIGWCSLTYWVLDSVLLHLLLLVLLEVGLRMVYGRAAVSGAHLLTLGQLARTWRPLVVRSASGPACVPNVGLHQSVRLPGDVAALLLLLQAAARGDLLAAL